MLPKQAKVKKIGNRDIHLQVKLLPKHIKVKQIGNWNTRSRAELLPKQAKVKRIGNRDTHLQVKPLPKLGNLQQIGKKEEYTVKNCKARFDILDTVEKRLSYLYDLRDEMEKRYSKFPEGNLHVAPGKSPESFRYYLRESPHDKLGKYLDKSKTLEKQQFATKKYLEKLLKNIQSEITKLEKVQSLNISDSIIDTYLNLNPGVKILIDPVNIDDKLFCDIWKRTPYNGLSFDEKDTSAFYSEKGERMRSKSEVLIANALNRAGLEYKYECPVSRKNGENLYPDFTILDEKRRRIVYWEHLGKMGDTSYVMRNIWKLDEYKHMGIYLGINLYVTYENGTNALGTDDISRTIANIQGLM